MTNDWSTCCRTPKSLMTDSCWIPWRPRCRFVLGGVVTALSRVRIHGGDTGRRAQALAETCPERERTHHHDGRHTTPLIDTLLASHRDKVDAKAAAGEQPLHGHLTTHLARGRNLYDDSLRSGRRNTDKCSAQGALPTSTGPEVFDECPPSGRCVVGTQPPHLCSASSNHWPSSGRRVVDAWSIRGQTIVDV